MWLKDMVGPPTFPQHTLQRPKPLPPLMLRASPRLSWRRSCPSHTQPPMPRMIPRRVQGPFPELLLLLPLLGVNGAAANAAMEHAVMHVLLGHPRADTRA